MVKVYSRSPIGHLFTVIDGGEEVAIDIKGMNSHKIMHNEKDVPYVTEVDDNLYAKIVDKYKSHLKLFGGVDGDGIKHDALIYSAKNAVEAVKKSQDSKPIVKRDSEIMVTKTKDIERFKDEDAV